MSGAVVAGEVVLSNLLEIRSNTLELNVPAFVQISKTFLTFSYSSYSSVKLNVKVESLNSLFVLVNHSPSILLPP